VSDRDFWPHATLLFLLKHGQTFSSLLEVLLWSSNMFLEGTRLWSRDCKGSEAKKDSRYVWFFSASILFSNPGLVFRWIVMPIRFYLLNYSTVVWSVQIYTALLQGKEAELLHGYAKCRINCLIFSMIKTLSLAWLKRYWACFSMSGNSLKLSHLACM